MPSQETWNILALPILVFLGGYASLASLPYRLTPLFTGMYIGQSGFFELERRTTTFLLERRMATPR